MFWFWDRPILHDSFWFSASIPFLEVDHLNAFQLFRLQLELQPVRFSFNAFRQKMLHAEFLQAVPSTDSFSWWGVISLPWATKNCCQTLVNLVSEYCHMYIIKNYIAGFDCGEDDSRIDRNHPQIYWFSNGYCFVNWKGVSSCKRFLTLPSSVYRSSPVPSAATSLSWPETTKLSATSWSPNSYLQINVYSLA